MVISITTSSDSKKFATLHQHGLIFIWCAERCAPITSYTQAFAGKSTATLHALLELYIGIDIDEETLLTARIRLLSPDRLVASSVGRIVLYDVKKDRLSLNWQWKEGVLTGY